MRVRLTSNKERIAEMREAFKETGGYCPCALYKTEDTKCVCKDFRDQIAQGIPGKCHCGLYECYNDDLHGGVINDLS